MGGQFPPDWGWSVCSGLQLKSYWFKGGQFHPDLGGQFDRILQLIEKPQLFNDQEQAKSLIEAGNLAITHKNYDRLREVNLGLISLLPKNVQQEAMTGGTIGFY
jgi:hypothetical protein